MKPKSKLTMVATTPGGIEAQEKAGQIEQSFLETLPIEGTIKASYSATKATWEALGFVFGDKADDLFVNVQFPKGWRKKPTYHPMWSYLLDDKGRERAAIFYKAASYDRSAHVSFNQRFCIGRYENDQVTIKDCGKVIEVIGSHEPRDYKAMDALEARARERLKEHYPDWNNPCAYWD